MKVFIVKCLTNNNLKGEKKMGKKIGYFVHVFTSSLKVKKLIEENLQFSFKNEKSGKHFGGVRTKSYKWEILINHNTKRDQKRNFKEIIKYIEKHIEDDLWYVCKSDLVEKV